MMENIKKSAPEVPVQEQLAYKICKTCGEKISGNFCGKCGVKVCETCNKCWVKNNQAYNCGFEKCPGYKLLALEKSKP